MNPYINFSTRHCVPGNLALLPATPIPCSSPVCESASKSCRLICVECPLGAEGQFSWEVLLLIIDDLVMNLPEAVGRNVKHSDKWLFVISLAHP